MRARQAGTALLLACALGAGGCSVLFDGHDLHGTSDMAIGGGGNGGTGGGGNGGGGMGGAGGMGGSGGIGGSGGGKLGTLAFSAAPGAPVLVGPTPLQLRVGDFDGDGHLDVVTSNSDAASLSFLFGDGKGGFSTAHNVPVPQPPGASIGACHAYALTVGELDGAAPIDVAATCTDLASVNGGVVVLGNSSRSFTTKAITGLQVTSTIQPESIAAGDFNHDGKLDLVVGVYEQPAKLLLLYGKGDGTFDTTATTIAIADGGSIESLAVGDLNHDGRDDIVASNDALGLLHVFLQTTSNTIPPTPVSYDGVSATMGVQLADVDHDGWLDIVACDAANWGLMVLLNAKDGTFPSAAGNRQPPEYGDTTSNPWHVAAGDLDRDGVPDLVSTAYNANTLDLFLGAGDGSFPKTGHTTHPNAMEPNDVAIADFNEDSLADIVYIEGFNPGGVYLLLNTSH